MQICCIASNIFGFTGGIQIYTRHLLENLQQLVPDADCQVLLKYDRPADITQADRPIPGMQFTGFGQWPRQLQTLFMTLAIWWIALRHPQTLFITTHVNYGKALVWAKRWFGIRYWIVAHGLEVWDIHTGLSYAALAEATAIAAVSHYTRNHLIEQQGLDPDRIHLLTNIFDAQRFQIQPKPDYLLKRHGLAIDQPVILTVCRLGKLDAYKGYEQILRSLPVIKQTIPNIHYLLVGKGDDQPRLQQLIQTLDIAANVTLTGFIPDAELPDYYNLCDLFAMPSAGEGFGIVYLEAMASGKPVLAGNADGAIDPLAQGKFGCLVNPANQPEITHALTQLLQGTYPNPRLYQPQVLRQWAVSSFTRSRFQAQLHYLLQQHQFSPMAATPPAEISYPSEL